MTEELIDQQAGAEENPATSETELEQSSAENTAATEATETVETDEQKNERVQREAREASEKRARGVQKRMDELTADKYAERKRADDLAEQNRRILALLEGKSSAGVAKPADRPTEQSHPDYAERVHATAVWDATQAARAEIEKSRKDFEDQSRRSTQEQQQRATISAYQERQRETAKSIPDFNTVMEDADVPVPQGVYNMILRIPDGPLVAYHMAKNPQLAEQFNAGNADMHGVLLGQLAATLKASQKTQSNAPPPGKTVRSTPGSDNEPPSDPDKYWDWAKKHMR